MAWHWTDSSGHALISALLGCPGDILVVATIQLECKGKNLGAAVIDTFAKHLILGLKIIFRPNLLFQKK